MRWAAVELRTGCDSFRGTTSAGGCRCEARCVIEWMRVCEVVIRVALAEQDQAGHGYGQGRAGGRGGQVRAGRAIIS